MDTIYKIAYILAGTGVLITLVLLLVELIKVLKKILSKKEELLKMKDGLEHIEKDAAYIKEVKDKTFLDELLLLISLVGDFRKFEKKEPGKVSAFYKAARKDLPKESLSQLKNKIKAL